MSLFNNSNGVSVSSVHEEKLSIITRNNFLLLWTCYQERGGKEHDEALLVFCADKFLSLDLKSVLEKEQFESLFSEVLWQEITWDFGGSSFCADPHCPQLKKEN